MYFVRQKLDNGVMQFVRQKYDTELMQLVRWTNVVRKTKT